jgi:hypothetical protein
MKAKFFFLALACMPLFTQCKKDPTPTNYDCTGLTPTYTGQIKAIMDNSCAMSGCHSSSSRASGIDLSSYSAVKTEAAKARFMGSMEHQSSYHAMPRGAAKLPDSTLQKLACWIDNGMPN